MTLAELLARTGWSPNTVRKHLREARVARIPGHLLQFNAEGRRVRGGTAFHRTAALAAIERVKGRPTGRGRPPGHRPVWEQTQLRTVRVGEALDRLGVPRDAFAQAYEAARGTARSQGLTGIRKPRRKALHARGVRRRRGVR